MPPPISSRSTLAQQVVDDAELVGDLGAAEHHRRTAAPGRSVSRLSTSTSAQHQAAGGVRQPLRHVVDAGVLAVHGAEAVADVERRPSAASWSANAPRSASSLLVSPGSNRRFSSSATSPSLERGHGGGGRRRRCRRRTRPAGRAARRAGRRPGERVRAGPAAPLGRPRWAHDDRPGRPRRRSAVERRQAGADPAVVGDHVAVSGTLRSARTRSAADAGPSAARTTPSGKQVVEGPHRRQSARADEARPGRRGGWSSPTRCRTSRRP